MLTRLGITVPVLAAPMAGCPTTPAMVIAASRAGSLGILAAGYKTASAIDEQIKQVRAEAIPFGVNVFAPNPLPIDPAEYHRYAAQIQTNAERFGLTLPPDPIEGTDTFDEKIALLLDDPVPLVSFTFGIPLRRTITALQHAGTVIVQTVTTVEEAIIARDAGVDVLAVQAHTAGGHSGTLTPAIPAIPTPIADLVAEITHRIEVPVVAAGGLATPEAVVEVMSAVAVATMVGTVLLRAAESGASATHQAALTDPSRTETVVTRAFTGRPARGLRNAFIDAHEADAPLGYPAIHYLTGPLRKAAAAAGQSDYVHLWAGTGYRHATAAPTADILHKLAGAL
jgi:NAD(P)H-dependent flavin oxidoreductase YrpB (nitropropane dioxygenase family)